MSKPGQRYWVPGTKVHTIYHKILYNCIVLDKDNRNGIYILQTKNGLVIKQRKDKVKLHYFDPSCLNQELQTGRLQSLPTYLPPEAFQISFD